MRKIRNLGRAYGQAVFLLVLFLVQFSLSFHSSVHPIHGMDSFFSYSVHDDNHDESGEGHQKQQSCSECLLAKILQHGLGIATDSISIVVQNKYSYDFNQTPQIYSYVTSSYSSRAPPSFLI